MWPSVGCGRACRQRPRRCGPTWRTSAACASASAPRSRLAQSKGRSPQAQTARPTTPSQACLSPRHGTSCRPSSHNARGTSTLIALGARCGSVTMSEALALRHLVASKIDARNRGPRKLLVRGPDDGRHAQIDARNRGPRKLLVRAPYDGGHAQIEVGAGSVKRPEDADASEAVLRGQIGRATRLARSALLRSQVAPGFGLIAPQRGLDGLRFGTMEVDSSLLSAGAARFLVERLPKSDDFRLGISDFPVPVCAQCGNLIARCNCNLHH
jgi:hypothetical protein